MAYISLANVHTGMTVRFHLCYPHNNVWAVLVGLVVLTAWNVLLRPRMLFPPSAPTAFAAAARHGLSDAFLISLVDRDDMATRTAAALGRAIVPNVTVVGAVDGAAILDEHMPLYTRHVIRAGRSDHMQIGNRAALGCLMSHGAVWRRIAASGAPALVFEEDVLVGPDSAALLAALLASVEHVPWGILMLDPGHVNVDGEWNTVAPMVANCSSASCVWYGTRAYALRPAVAALLLAHMEPMVLQVDAVITLVAAYHAPAVRMYWTTARIFPYNLTRPSAIFDGCIKCYLPTGARSYVIFVVIIVVAAVFFGIGTCR